MSRLGYGINNLGSDSAGTEGEESPSFAPPNQDLGYGLYGYGTSHFGSVQTVVDTIDVALADTLDFLDDVEIQGGVDPVKNVTLLDGLDIVESGVALDILLRVSSAIAVNSYGILVTFSNNINPGYPPFEQISNYQISPPLLVASAQIVGASQVLVQTVSPQLNTTYTITVQSGESLTGDFLGPHNSASFAGFTVTTSFIAGVLSASKIGLEFSAEMAVGPALINPSNYSVVANLGGVAVPISSVVMGPAPVRRVTLMLGTPLTPKAYYSVVVGPTVVSALGSSMQPNTQTIMWEALKPYTELPISDFSGEVSGGLLGTPEGQVFFSPALENSVSAMSSIEIEEVSVCTRSYDEYHIPDIPDPEPLYTYGRGQTASLLGQVVLWAPADRLGQAKMTFRDHQAENVLPKVYVPSTTSLESPISDFGVGVLRETINTTRAAFLNDVRWKTYPNTGALVFRTADNLTSIGSGPTTQVQLSTVRDVRVMDNVLTTDGPTIP